MSIKRILIRNRNFLQNVGGFALLDISLILFFLLKFNGQISESLIFLLILCLLFIGLGILIGLFMFGVLSDYSIDQHQELKNALSLSEENFRSLTEAIPQFVWTATPDGQMDYFNEKWYNYSGYTFEQSKGLGWLPLIHPDDLEITLNVWEKAIKSGSGSYETEYRILGKDGKYQWFLGRALALHDKNNQVIKWFGTSTDIDNQKSHEAKIKESLDSKDEFFSIASHELKTPLTSLKLQIDLIKRFLSRDDHPNLQNYLKESINVCDHQVDRLSKLINSMLDLGRIKANKFILNLSEFDLIKLTEKTLLNMSEDIKYSGSKVEQEVLSPIIIGNWDCLKIEQVLINVLTNAMKYGMKKPIKILLEQKENKAIIKIIDHGIGIKPENLNKIFEKFERTTETADITGLGLGLFIVKKIIDEHQGSITISSKFEQGSTFIIELPLKKS